MQETGSSDLAKHLPALQQHGHLGASTYIQETGSSDLVQVSEDRVEDLPKALGGRLLVRLQEDCLEVHGQPVPLQTDKTTLGHCSQVQTLEN